MKSGLKLDCWVAIILLSPSDKPEPSRELYATSQASWGDCGSISSSLALPLPLSDDFIFLSSCSESESESEPASNALSFPLDSLGLFVSSWLSNNKQGDEEKFLEWIFFKSSMINFRLKISLFFILYVN